MYPVGRSTDVLLASAEWRLRAPLRAQLIEDGYEVIALESWDEAELLLQARAIRPRLLILDTQGETNPEAGLRTFGRLAGEAPVIVLTAASALSAAEVHALGFEHVIARPFMIRDVERRAFALVPPS